MSILNIKNANKTAAIEVVFEASLNTCSRVYGIKLLANILDST